MAVQFYSNVMPVIEFECVRVFGDGLIKDKIVKAVKQEMFSQSLAKWTDGEGLGDFDGEVVMNLERFYDIFIRNRDGFMSLTDVLRFFEQEDHKVIVYAYDCLKSCLSGFWNKQAFVTFIINYVLTIRQRDIDDTVTTMCLMELIMWSYLGLLHDLSRTQIDLDLCFGVLE